MRLSPDRRPTPTTWASAAPFPRPVAPSHMLAGMRMKSGVDSSRKPGTPATGASTKTDSSPATRPGAPPQSPHALQLQRGFPRLEFTAPLEAEFRQVHLAETLPQIRRN